MLLIVLRERPSGAPVRETPGGGIEAGESPLTAARRELQEETGLDPRLVTGVGRPWPRDVTWNGERRVGHEHFFLARVPAGTVPATDGMVAYEAETFIGFEWWHWSAFADVPGRLEPVDLLDLLRALAPDGPWAAGAPPAPGRSTTSGSHGPPQGV